MVAVPLFLVATVNADTLILRDGRRIQGQLISFQNGVVEFQENGFFGRLGRINRDEIVGIEAPERLRVVRGRVRPGDLAGETLLVREQGSSTRAVSERGLMRAGCRPAKRWELDSNEAIKRSVAAGLGIGFVSRLVVADETARGELVEFALEGVEPLRRSVYLVRPGDRDPTPAEQAFIRTLCSCCSASVAGCTADGS